MARKDFHFDFNEDADPVEELHRLRVAATKHFKTVDALLEYHRATPPVKDLIAELDEEIAKKKTRRGQPSTPKAAKNVKARHIAKCPLHA